MRRETSETPDQQLDSQPDSEFRMAYLAALLRGSDWGGNKRRTFEEQNTGPRPSSSPAPC